MPPFVVIVEDDFLQEGTAAGPPAGVPPPTPGWTLVLESEFSFSFTAYREEAEAT